MPRSLCPHLDEYGAQFIRTRASYEHCLSLLDRIVADGPGGGLAALVIEALSAWSEEDEKLRQALVELVSGGKVQVPKQLLRKGSTRAHADRSRGTIICATCRRAVPRLEYPEWKFAHNGVVTFRGVEMIAAPVPA